MYYTYANKLQLLTAVPSAPRATLHTEALETARQYERAALRRIQHMNLNAAELEIRPNKQKGFGFSDDFYDGGGGGQGRQLRSKDV